MINPRLNESAPSFLHTKVDRSGFEVTTFDHQGCRNTHSRSTGAIWSIKDVREKDYIIIINSNSNNNLRIG